jgi:Lysine-specific metallo-endopeptidase
MATVSVEMSPREFPVVEIQGTFKENDVVTLDGPKARLRGVVRSITTKMMGNPQEPTTVLGIAINRGDVSPFKNGGFEGFKVEAVEGGAKGTVRAKCQTKFAARLLKTTELQTMLNKAEELIDLASQGKNSEYVTKWFGPLAEKPESQRAVFRGCAELKQYVAGLSNVILVCKDSETLGGIDSNDPLRNGPTCRIELGRGFTYDRYSWGERVCTLIHEMTHWFLKTVDVEMTDGTEAYGVNCLKLANSASEGPKAMNNADNWAYYICEYRSVSERAKNDWRFFTTQEIIDRGPFASNGYNVVQSLIARYD